MCSPHFLQTSSGSDLIMPRKITINILLNLLLNIRSKIYFLPFHVPVLIKKQIFIQKIPKTYTPQIVGFSGLQRLFSKNWRPSLNGIQTIFMRISSDSKLEPRQKPPYNAKIAKYTPWPQRGRRNIDSSQ